MVSDIEGVTREFLASYPLMYEQSIYPELKHLRGFTRLRQWVRSIGIELVSSKTSDGCYRLEVVQGKPSFQSKNDLKYYFFEYSYFARLFNELLEADVFCDVGGYHGFYSLVSSSERSIVFEADPANADHIRENIELNADKDVELVEKAVWSSKETLNFEADGSGTSHVSQNGIEREAVTLDSFFDDRQDPDVLKIDVEGAEGHVLEGSEELLERSHPTLFIEFHFENRIKSFGHSYEDLKAFLENLGYSFSVLEDRGSERLVIAR